MTTDPLIGQVLGKRYQVTRLLGQGGMGSVYEAVHCELDKKVAVKLLLPHVAENAEAYERFRREAQASSRMRHPNILEVTDFDHTEQGAPYMVMEYLDGEDLSDLLARERRLPLGRAITLFLEVLDAVEAAHQGGIIHRDLKPENIYLCRYGARDELPKVLDFGISKIMDATSQLTRPQAMMGTPSYMAPEQAQGKTGSADARTDIFALGTILYRMLAGQEAFGGGKALSIIYRVVNEEPPPLSEVVPGLAPAVAAVVERAMAKEPADRFPSASAMAAALTEAVNTEAAPAPVPVPAHTEPGLSATLAAEPSPQTDPGLSASLDGESPQATGHGKPLSSMLTPDLTGELTEHLTGRRNQRSGGMAGAAGAIILLLALGFGAWMLKSHMGQSPPKPELARPQPPPSAPPVTAPPDAAPPAVSTKVKPAKPKARKHRSTRRVAKKGSPGTAPPPKPAPTRGVATLPNPAETTAKTKPDSGATKRIPSKSGVSTLPLR